MFGFQGGEDTTTVSRKKSYMKDAQQHWGFLTNFDLSTIKNKMQLCSMIRDRMGVSEVEAESDVTTWMQNKQF
jgi:hypothetical protein